jgi:hypothetical protein
MACIITFHTLHVNKRRLRSLCLKWTAMDSVTYRVNSCCLVARTIDATRVTQARRPADHSELIICVLTGMVCDRRCSRQCLSSLTCVKLHQRMHSFGVLWPAHYQHASQA